MANHFPMVSWANGATIYEVNIRQYTPEGTFGAFAQHLPRLQQMGVRILWFMPITPIGQLNRLGTLGSYYACSSYTDINPEFGTIADFKAVVQQAQALGMKVIIDWVANHTGWDHHWTKEHPDWYVKDAHGNFTEKNGWKDVIDLDYTQSEMRKAMIAAMQFWIHTTHIDGFRCDMAHLVPLDFWMEARQQCDTVKPLFWLAETENVPYHDAFDVSYAWDWMHQTEAYVKGTAGMSNLYNTLHNYSQYPANSYKLFFTSNHDENSWNGTEYEKYGGAALPLAVHSFLWKGFPLIYSGQESPNKKRLSFFNKDEIEWQQPLGLAHLYTGLAGLRQTALVMQGETFILPVNSNNVMAFMRHWQNEVLLVMLNLSGADKQKFTVNHPWLNGAFTNPLSGFQFIFTGPTDFELQGYEYLVYHKVATAPK
ncbi:alpha-amylase family glycosyl hydrolase [Hydrotalea sp.]|uniref:alpha-amylase family glycosyl hydrolase n=1 Tax=Hydrotalea sp. TaxID=2881279 RepID=UPI0026375881|nr:alpha-amylase family glycosyl hydrolase [Hydrotalea sp.]